MTKRRTMEWDSAEWLNDAGVRACSLATRAIWFDLLNHMHQNGDTGEVTGTVSDLANIVGCTDEDMRRAINELEATETALVTHACHAACHEACHGACHATVTVRHLGMWKKYQTRKGWRERQLRRRVKKALSPSQECHADVTLVVTGSVTPHVTPAKTPISEDAPRLSRTRTRDKGIKNKNQFQSPYQYQKQNGERPETDLEQIWRQHPDLAQAKNRTIEPLPAGLLRYAVFERLQESHLLDTRRLVEWHRRQLSAEDPVIGNTEADLLLVIAAGLYASKNMTVKKPVGAFVMALRYRQWKRILRYVGEAKKRLDQEKTGAINDYAAVS